MEVPWERQEGKATRFWIVYWREKKKERTHTSSLYPTPHSQKKKEKGYSEGKSVSFLSFYSILKGGKSFFFGTNAEPFKMDWSGKKERLKTDSIYSLKYKVSLKSKVFTFKVMSAFLLSKSPWKWQKQCNKVTLQRERAEKSVSILKWICFSGCCSR